MQYDLSPEVHDAVCFYCRSYHQREYILRETICPPAIRSAYSAINETIREAIGTEYGERMRDIIIEDIARGRGWGYSPAVSMISEKAYKAYKRRAKILIAKRLGLCR